MDKTELNGAKMLVEKAINEAAFQMSRHAYLDEDEERKQWEARPEYEVKADYKNKARTALMAFNSIMNLAVINKEKELPRIHYGSYLSVKGGDKEIIGFELAMRRMKEEGFIFSVVPLSAVM